MQIQNTQWRIVTFNGPVIFDRDREERWFMNPVRRYVFNANHLPRLEPHVDTVSDINGSRHYKPLNGHAALGLRRVLVERYRDRGIGDLLFLTGPLSYLQHLNGGGVKFHVYAFADRGQVLQNSDLLEHRTVLVGPTHYDDFQHYDAQWLVDSVSESNQEKDQLNVYDALYRQLGIDPETVEPRFKRPTMSVLQHELDGLNQFFFRDGWLERHIDLRATGYYVVAPFTHSPMRMPPYKLWQVVIKDLSQRRPVIVVGNPRAGVPALDMDPGDFVASLNEMGENVINLIRDDRRPTLRAVCTMIYSANCVVTLDSGPLYIAQALRTPAISIWGPHDPSVRIGYDQDYMDWAVWTPETCVFAPCYCFGSFPVDKCPRGHEQQVCEVFSGVSPDAVLAKLERVEFRSQRSVGVLKPGQPSA
jgi:hypothetical protein